MDLNSMKEMARRASHTAYCPYSKFRVGAAVYHGSDIVVGCNVENASYGLTICAERNAIFQLLPKGIRFVSGVVIYTPTPKPSAPCGACRQVINEFGPHAHIHSFCDGPDVLDTTMDLLLPHAFGPHNLVGGS
jgi:cytidine deaminase